MSRYYRIAHSVSLISMTALVAGMLTAASVRFHGTNGSVRAAEFMRRLSVRLSAHGRCTSASGERGSARGPRCSRAARCAPDSRGTAGRCATDAEAERGEPDQLGRPGPPNDRSACLTVLLRAFAATLVVSRQCALHRRAEARELSCDHSADDDDVDRPVVVDDPGTDALDIGSRDIRDVGQGARRGLPCLFSHLSDPHQHGVDRLGVLPPRSTVCLRIADRGRGVAEEFEVSTP